MNECKNSGVIYSDLDEIANRPVEILPDQRYLDYTPDHNFVQNCYIHSTGVKNPKFCAIYVRGTGNVVSHNLLQGGFSVSIYLQYAKECIVEYNTNSEFTQQRQARWVRYSMGFRNLGELELTGYGILDIIETENECVFCCWNALSYNDYGSVQDRENVYIAFDKDWNLLWQKGVAEK